MCYEFVSRVFQGCYNGASRVFNGNFKVASGVFQRRSNEFSCRFCDSCKVVLFFTGS